MGKSQSERESCCVWTPPRSPQRAQAIHTYLPLPAATIHPGAAPFASEPEGRTLLYLVPLSQCGIEGTRPLSIVLHGAGAEIRAIAR